MLARIVLCMTCTLFSGLTLAVGQANAADIRLVSSPFCRIALSGPIVPGDRERLAALVAGLQASGEWEAGESTDAWRLCLDSPGGELAEGVELAEFIFETGIGTVLPPGSSCVSACALIFMLGFAQGDEMHWTNRRMHHTARLGFHAPRLVLPANATFTSAQIEDLETRLNRDFAHILRMSNARVLGTPPAIEADLLEEMFAHDADGAMFFVDTVDDAGRWRIEVFGYAYPRRIDALAALWACTNLTRWPFARSTRSTRAPAMADDPAEVHAQVPPHGTETWIETAGLDAGYYRHECRVLREVRGWHTSYASVAICGLNEARDAALGAPDACFDPGFAESALISASALAVFPPQTRLIDLPTAALTIEARAVLEAAEANSPRLHRSCWPQANRFRITRVNEYATLRRTPGFGSEIVARLPLGTIVDRAGDPFLAGDPARNAACRTACNAAGRMATQVNAEIAACYLDSTLWFPVRFGGQQGYVGGRFLAE